MHRREFLTLAAGLPLLAQTRKGPMAEIPADVLEDKIRGGFLGQVIGDLNGLEHEMPGGSFRRACRGRRPASASTTPT